MEKSIFYLLLQYYPLPMAISIIDYLRLKGGVNLRRPKGVYTRFSLNSFVRQYTGKSLHFFAPKWYHYYPMTSNNSRNLRKYIYDHKVLN